MQQVHVMFSRALSHAGHSRRFTLDSLQADGWEVRVEDDGVVVKRSVYTDWHRVERALGAVEREVQALQAAGWEIANDDALAGGGQSTKR